ncbi:MAG: hypothetical protein K0R69_2488 [Clostridia bacterium]|jgi:hypothetical protein|nr:hypothetical protein [Clostridia bacterium]
MHGIKSIGIRVADKGNLNHYEEMDVIIGKHMDLEMHYYYPNSEENPEAMGFV